MFKQFIEKKFNITSQMLIAIANKIIVEYQADGYDLTLRQLYYQFVSRDLLPKKWADKRTGSTNNERSYKNLGKLINDGRLAGEIDWDAIVDRTRLIRSLSYWNNPAEIIEAAVKSYRRNFWDEQKNYVEVWVEKEALIGVLQRVCNKMRVSYFGCKGYISQSAMYERAQILQGMKEHEGKTPYVLYLGDHDPSGLDMARDIRDRISLLTFDDVDGYDCVKHIALTREQIDEKNPPPNPTKITDSRARTYMSVHGDESWELDALDPSYLSKLIESEINILIDWNEWDKSQDRETNEKELLEEKAQEIKEAVSNNETE